MITEIKVGGLGGQGVILAAIIIGRSATLFANQYATMTQSFGPEARGSACSAQVICSDEVILYPYVTHPDILIVMSQDAFNKFSPQINKNGIILYEEDLVTPSDEFRRERADVRFHGIPATRIAEKLGRRMVLNIVMLGFFDAVTDILKAESIQNGIRESVPRGTEELNIKAFRMGYEFGKELLAKRGEF